MCGNGRCGNKKGQCNDCPKPCKEVKKGKKCTDMYCNPKKKKEKHCDSHESSSSGSCSPCHIPHSNKKKVKKLLVKDKSKCLPCGGPRCKGPLIYDPLKMYQKCHKNVCADKCNTPCDVSIFIPICPVDEYVKDGKCTSVIAEDQAKDFVTEIVQLA
jgi:hypothetical protein